MPTVGINEIIRADINKHFVADLITAKVLTMEVQDELSQDRKTIRINKRL